MKERVIRFGATSNLVGILTEPDAHVRVDDAPVAIFLNSGIIHRVGASRIHVQLARRLAADGYTSLRFDHSGIGDSEPRRDSLRFDESAVLETQEAMDHLGRTTGASRFVLVGLCSGADMAFATGIRDPRVVGLVQFDPYAYRTPKWFVRYYGPRVLRLGVWTNAVRVRWRELVERLRPDANAGAPSVFVAPEYRRTFPPRSVVASGLSTLMERGAQLLIYFTGHETHINYPEQYAESFAVVDFGNRLSVHHFPGADHTFTALHWQARLVDEVGSWYQTRRFGEVHDTPSLISASP